MTASDAPTPGDRGTGGDSANTVYDAADVLAFMRVPEATAALVDVVDHPDVFPAPAVRAAWQRLPMTHERIAADRLLARASSPDAMIRQEVAESLTQSRDPRCAVALQRLLADPDPTVRWAAIAASFSAVRWWGVAWSQIDDERCWFTTLSTFTATLDDTDHDQSGCLRAIDALAARLQFAADPMEAGKRFRCEADPAVGELIVRLLDHRDARTRSLSISAKIFERWLTCVGDWYGATPQEDISIIRRGVTALVPLLNPDTDPDETSFVAHAIATAAWSLLDRDRAAARETAMLLRSAIDDAHDDKGREACARFLKYPGDLQFPISNALPRGSLALILGIDVPEIKPRQEPSAAPAPAPDDGF